MLVNWGLSNLVAMGGGCIDRPSFYGGRVCCGRTPTGFLEPVGLLGEVISASVTLEKVLLLIILRRVRRVGRAVEISSG